MKKLALERRECVALDPEVERDFSALNGYQARARHGAVTAACCMVMEGVELKRLKEKYHVRPGNPNSQAAVNSRSLRELNTDWAAIVRTYGGYSEDTAARRVALMEKLEPHLPLIAEFLGSYQDFHLRPESERLALAEAFQISLGSAMPKQLCFELGLGEKPKPAGGDRGGGGKRKALTAEEQVENATQTGRLHLDYLRQIQDDEVTLKLCSLEVLDGIEEQRLNLGRKIAEIKALRKLPQKGTKGTRVQQEDAEGAERAPDRLKAELQTLRSLRSPVQSPSLAEGRA